MNHRKETGCKNLMSVCSIIIGACQKEYIKNFDKFRWLHGHTGNGKRQIGTVHRPSDDQYNSKGENSCQGIDINQVSGISELLHKGRDRDGDDQSDRSDDKLFYSLIEREPGDDDQTDGEHHTDMRIKNPVAIRIKCPVQKDSHRHHYSLEQPEKQEPCFLLSRINGEIGERLIQEQDPDQQAVRQIVLPAMSYRTNLQKGYRCIYHHIDRNRIPGQRQNIGTHQTAPFLKCPVVYVKLSGKSPARLPSL